MTPTFYIHAADFLVHPFRFMKIIFVLIIPFLFWVKFPLTSKVNLFLSCESLELCINYNNIQNFHSLDLSTDVMLRSPTCANSPVYWRELVNVTIVGNCQLLSATVAKHLSF